MIRFDCPHCGHSLQVQDSGSGKKGKCKKCGESLVVPESSDVDFDDDEWDMPTNEAYDDSLAPLPPKMAKQVKKQKPGKSAKAEAKSLFNRPLPMHWIILVIVGLVGFLVLSLPIWGMPAPKTLGECDEYEAAEIKAFQKHALGEVLREMDRSKHRDDEMWHVKRAIEAMGNKGLVSSGDAVIDAYRVLSFGAAVIEGYQACDPYGSAFAKLKDIDEKYRAIVKKYDDYRISLGKKGG